MQATPAVFLAMASFCLPLLAQAIRAPSTATPGSSIAVNVASNDLTIEVVNPVTGQSTTHPVAPGKDTSIPLPDVPGGTILSLVLGKGTRAHVVLIEVISLS